MVSFYWLCEIYWCKRCTARLVWAHHEALHSSAYWVTIDSFQLWVFPHRLACAFMILSIRRSAYSLFDNSAKENTFMPPFLTLNALLSTAFTGLRCTWLMQHGPPLPFSVENNTSEATPSITSTLSSSDCIKNNLCLGSPQTERETERGASDNQFHLSKWEHEPHTGHMALFMKH